jgi:hypothetical protein
MLAPLQTTEVDKLNLAANQKLKSHLRIATGPQVDGPSRNFFPVKDVRMLTTNSINSQFKKCVKRR